MSERKESRLPYDVCEYILKFLDQRDAVKLSKTNRFWRTLYRKTGYLKTLSIYDDNMCYLAWTHRLSLDGMAIHNCTLVEKRICTFPRIVTFRNTKIENFPLLPQVTEFVSIEAGCRVEKINWHNLPRLKIIYIEDDGCIDPTFNILECVACKDLIRITIKDQRSSVQLPRKFHDQFNGTITVLGKFNLHPEDFREILEELNQQG